MYRLSLKSGPAKPTPRQLRNLVAFCFETHGLCLWFLLTTFPTMKFTVDLKRFFEAVESWAKRGGGERGGGVGCLA